MKLIVDLPEKLINEIRQKVENGTFSSISSFILAGVENQLILESEETNFIDNMESRSNKNVIESHWNF